MRDLAPIPAPLGQWSLDELEFFEEQLRWMLSCIHGKESPCPTCAVHFSEETPRFWDWYTTLLAAARAELVERRLSEVEMVEELEAVFDHLEA
jgi:hypothetical protein